MGNDTSKSEVKKKFDVNELKTYLMIIQSKLTQTRNKKINEIKKKQEEALNCFRDNNIEVGKLKVESIMRCEDYISAFDVLGILCEILKEKVSYINFSDVVPEDLRASLDSMVFASSRLEIEEMHKFRELIKAKFGMAYIYDANENKSGLVNVNIVKKLSPMPYSAYMLTTRMKQIANDADVPLNLPEELIDPIQDMSNPFGGNNFNQDPNINLNNNNNFNNYNQNPNTNSIPSQNINSNVDIGNYNYNNNNNNFNQVNQQNVQSNNNYNNDYQNNANVNINNNNVNNNGNIETSNYAQFNNAYPTMSVLVPNNNNNNNNQQTNINYTPGQNNNQFPQ